MSREAEIPSPRAAPLTRIGLTALMVVAALNVWTGSPLLALWVGSRVQGSGPPTMFAVFVVVVVFGTTAITLTVILGRLGAVYDRISGRPPSVRQHTPWLRSMRGEREQDPGVAAHLTPLERIVVAMVVIAFLVFEIWFFFFSTSPIDNRSGRGTVVPLTASADLGENSPALGRTGE